MVVFASARASWMLSLAFFGLACIGTREDPSPGDAPPIFNSTPGTGGAGGGAGGGGVGGNTGGSAGSGIPFPDCGCAAIIESNTVAACNLCVDNATGATDPCNVQLVACDGNSVCSIARNLLLNNDCEGDPTCAETLLNGILDDTSAGLLLDYYSCVCEPCGVCSAGGVGGGGVGGAAQADGTCEPSPS